jgi:hypothetical protein
MEKGVSTIGKRDPSLVNPIQRDPLHYHAPLIILVSHPVVIGDILDICVECRWKLHCSKSLEAILNNLTRSGRHTCLTLNIKKYWMVVPTNNPCALRV